jgi:hypothetical protein
MPVESVPYSVHTWPGVLKHLKQMQITGSRLEEGMNWRTSESSSTSNRTGKLLVFLRGNSCSEAITETDKGLWSSAL